MASPNINIWFRVDITLKHLQDQTSKVITVTSRPLRGENPHETFAILDSINGLGLAAGQSGMPTSSTGSITLLDTFESFGSERRFFDLLERYTPIEQTVQVYATQTALDDNAAYSDFTSVWKGKCKSISRSGDLTLDVESQIFETRYVTQKIIDTFSYSSVNYSVPDSSIGKDLPLIFGSSIQVPAYPATDYSEYTQVANYLYGVNFSQDFKLGAAIQKYYAKCFDGIYRRVYSLNNSTSFGTLYGTGSNYPTALGLTEHGVDIKIDAGEYYIITNGRWRFKGQNNGGITPAGNIIFNCYLTNTNSDTPELVPVARAVVPKADYLSNVRGASDFWVTFYLDKPVVFGEGLRVPRLTMVLDNYDTSLTDFVDGGTNATGTYYNKLSNNEWSIEQSGYVPLYQLYALQLDDQIYETVDSTGIQRQGFQASQQTVTTTLDPTDISDIDFIVEANGILDDGSGTITGSASSVIKYPNHILKLLGYTWNGTNWVDSGNYDFTQFSTLYSSVFVASGTYARFIGGATEGQTTLEDFISELMNQSASQLVQLTNGKLTIWPWGTTQSVSRVFSDEKTRVTNWRRLDSSSVINQVKIAYAKNLTNAAENDLGVGGGSFNFASILDWTVTSYPLINMLIEDSAALYGKKPPIKTELNLINDTTSAETYGYSLLRQFDHPHTLAEVSVDFWQNKDLELMQIVELVSPVMPSYLGTTTHARLPTYDGNDVQVSQGDYWKRATRYRCQIISRVISWSRSTLPSLVLGFRVITPYHLNDPT